MRGKQHAFYYPGAAIVKKSYSKPALTAVTVPDHSNATMVWNRVNVRLGPDTSYDSIGKLPEGARIEVIEPFAAAGTQTKWHKILYGGQYAYVAASVTEGGKTNTYVELDEPASQRETYTISFATNKGSAVSAVKVLRAGNIAAAPATSRKGYALAGWCRDSSLKVFAKFPYIATRNATLYAKWNPVSYKISYSLNGGKASNPTSYTIESGAITLKNPTRTGYDFTGWSGTGITGKSMSVTVPKGSVGDRTYTANWKQQTQTAYLSGLKLSIGSLSPAFAKTRYSYKIRLAENAGSVTITPKKEYDGASMTIAGKTRSNYTVSLSNGKSTNVYVKVKYKGITKTYKLTVSRASSTNNYLSKLTATKGKFDSAFNPADTSYTLTLDENVKSTKITAAAAAGKLAKVSASQTVTLKNGGYKKVKIKVKSQSGKYRTYTIKVVRKPSANSNLSYLKTSSKSLSLKLKFSSGKTNYTITMPANKSSVTISAKAAGYKAAVYINGKKATSKKITLKAGASTTVRVVVRAQSKAEKVYTITVNRLVSKDANLKSLKTSSSSFKLSPAFKPGVTSYNVTLSKKSGSVTLYAKANGYGAKVKIDGRSTSSKKITLKRGGSRTVHVVVTSQAGNTKEYVIKVKRR